MMAKGREFKAMKPRLLWLPCGVFMVLCAWCVESAEQATYMEPLPQDERVLTVPHKLRHFQNDLVRDAIFRAAPCGGAINCRVEFLGLEMGSDYFSLSHQAQKFECIIPYRQACVFEFYAKGVGKYGQFMSSCVYCNRDDATSHAVVSAKMMQEHTQMGLFSFTYDRSAGSTEVFCEHNIRHNAFACTRLLTGAGEEAVFLSARVRYENLHKVLLEWGVVDARPRDELFSDEDVFGRKVIDLQSRNGRGEKLCAE